MRCVACSADSRRKQIQNGRCPACGRPFALANHTETPIRDYLFFVALARVSSHGIVFFGRENLYQDLRRRLGRRRNALKIALFSSAVSFITLVFLSRSATLSVPFAIIFFASVYFSLRSGPIGALSREAFERVLSLYTGVHGVPPKLLEPRRAPRGPSPLSQISEEELARYSFDRAVVCDRPETVDLLIANQFHFENNCAVLGIDGYPPEGFELVRRMLRNNPRLLVLTLHDATEAGCRLAYRVRNDVAWFRGQGTVVDVGLRPAHAKFFPRLHERRSGEQVVPGGGITAREAGWLSRYTLSLGVLPPEQIVKRLFRAIHAAENPGSAAGSIAASGADPVVGDVILFGSHAGASDGGADSFG